MIFSRFVIGYKTTNEKFFFEIRDILNEYYSTISKHSNQNMQTHESVPKSIAWWCIKSSSTSNLTIEQKVEKTFEN